MYVIVRTVDGKRQATLTISKLTTVGAFKKLIEKELEVKTKSQKLFYGGKQLENGYKMFDYNVRLNDVIQLMILPDKVEQSKKSDDIEEKKVHPSESKEGEPKNEKKSPSVDSEEKKKEGVESLYYRVGDFVDAKQGEMASWFEGKILSILPNPDVTDFDRANPKDDGLLYKVTIFRYEEDEPSLVKVGDLRPVARQRISQPAVGDMVLASYNMEEPKLRGNWFDFKVEGLSPLSGILIVGNECARMCDVVIKHSKDLYAITEVKLLSDRTPDQLDLLSADIAEEREYPPHCSKCLDDDTKKCKECSCLKCGGKDQPDKQILCDECQSVFHLWCLSPPLKQLPEEDDWYCYDCKNDENEVVKAGDQLKASKKKAAMASAKCNSGRDWGKGMACVGRTKVCTIVPTNHFGPVPGIDVGTCWKFRVQVSEAGVHRPHVAGIAGRENEGAYSIVLSGGYEDDIDDGDRFIYTGSGGRDLSGNKRTADQSSDQTLTRMNKALALNCNAELNEDGAEAVDWRGGKPVRVIRNYKAAKHSNYAPEEGNRYDGIYKVVKYYPEKGKSGYIVWRYLLKRDDPSPAPWTEEGRKRVSQLGLDIIYPDGYLEAMEAKEKKEEAKEKPGSKRRRKTLEEGEKEVEVDAPSAPAKVRRTEATGYSLDKEAKDLVAADSINSKLWQTAMEALPQGKLKFLAKVEEVFMCICCQELLYKPVTTPCNHNICLACLKRSFAAEVYSCPMCRSDLSDISEPKLNEQLQSALLLLYPGYSAAR